MLACLDCGLPYEQFPLDLNLPRAQWLAIHPDDGGVLCACCIVARIKARIPGATVVHAIAEVSPRRVVLTNSTNDWWHVPGARPEA